MDKSNEQSSSHHESGVGSNPETPTSNPLSSPVSSTQNRSPVPSEDGKEGESQGDEQLNLGKKKKYKSEAWNHFILKMVNGVAKAECKRRMKLLSGDTKNGTTHLNDHYKRHCKKREGQQDIRQALLVKNQVKQDGNMMLCSTMFNQEDGRLNLAKMVILHEYPLRMVQHEGFQKFCQTLQPCFKIPSRFALKRDLLKVYDFEKKIQSLLDKTCSRIAVTIDMWTVNYQRRGYM